MLISNRDYTEDVFEYLLAKEMKPLDMPRTSSITRACVINWLMKVNVSELFLYLQSLLTRKVTPNSITYIFGKLQNTPFNAPNF